MTDPKSPFMPLLNLGLKAISNEVLHQRFLQGITEVPNVKVYISLLDRKAFLRYLIFLIALEGKFDTVPHLRGLTIGY